MAKGNFIEVTTTGPIEWARVFEDTRDMEGYEGAYRDCDGAYTVNQVLSKEEYKKLRDAGSQKKFKEKRFEETEERVVGFMRKHTVRNRNGEIVEKASGAPEVLNSMGEPWDREKDGLIGNGSIAEVTNLISKFKGSDDKVISRTALKSVKIIELVPYEAKEPTGDEIGF